MSEILNLGLRSVLPPSAPVSLRLSVTYSERPVPFSLFRSAPFGLREQPVGPKPPQAEDRTNGKSFAFSQTHVGSSARQHRPPVASVSLEDTKIPRPRHFAAQEPGKRF